MKKLLLIDGNSLVNRAYYALPQLTNRDGVPTGAVHGFLSMLFSFLRSDEFDHLIVAFDTPEKTFRHEKYTDYKATRKGMPEELAQQMPILKEILHALKIMQIERDGFEADDLIGTLALRGKEEGFSSLILTGDRDLLQLVREHIEVAIPKKGVSDLLRYDKGAVFDEMGLHPDQVIDYKGLRGDPSDNIPGIKGIGDVTAKKYLKGDKHLEDLYDTLPKEPKNRIERLLLEGREIAFLSRELATIHTQVPIEFQEIEQSSLMALTPEKAVPILEKYQLRAILTELRKNYIHEEKESEEKASLEGSTDTLPSIAYAEGTEGPVYAFHSKKTSFHSSIAQLIKEAGALNEVAVYDAKLIWLHAMQEGIELPFALEDVKLLTYLVHPLINANQPAEVFASVSKEYVDWKVLQKDKSRAEELVKHLAVNSSLLAPALLEELERKGMLGLYRDLELPLTPVLTDMQWVGFRVDSEILEQIGDEIEEKIISLAASIHQLAGRPFNISSPKQLGEVLFEELLLPVVKKTKSGYSTDKDVLEKLRGRHPIIEDIVSYRTYTKLKGTYIDGLLREITPDGRIHSNLQQTIAITGRLSSTDPNLQNIPIRLEEGRRIRKAFLPSEGNVLLSADYNQIELRVLAHISGDEELKQAFIKGEDIHAQTASLVFGVPLPEVSAAQRREAKAVNFGIVYGISDFGLSENISIPIEQARVYKERYFSHYPGVKSYMEESVKFCRAHGYVQTILGRTRPIPDIQAKNYNVRSFAERAAINTPIQGSAADIIKLAMLRVSEALREKSLSARLILQVHDELILDVPTSEIDEVKGILHEAMVSAYKLSVPLKVSMSTGESWYDI